MRKQFDLKKKQVIEENGVYKDIDIYSYSVIRDTL